jgi:hypothetical protein
MASKEEDTWWATIICTGEEPCQAHEVSRFEITGAMPFKSLSYTVAGVYCDAHKTQPDRDVAEFAATLTADKSEPCPQEARLLATDEVVPRGAQHCVIVYLWYE